MIYFDNSATTPVSKAVADEIYSVLTEGWGNPSAANGKGVEAAKLLSSCEKDVLSLLGVRDVMSGQLVFTGSGTEADNQAIIGSIFSKNFRYKPRIITDDSEHPAVLRAFEEAERRGCEVRYLHTVGGVIDPEELESYLTPETVLISLMRVNNETGAIYDVRSAFRAAKAKCPDIVTHCDAVQGFGKTDCSPKSLGADLVSVSGHKIGGPKGIGALWIDKKLLTARRVSPIIFGGGQMQGLRSGTENMPGIVGIAAAARLRKPAEELKKVVEVREAILSTLPEGVTLNACRGEYLPHILSLRCEGVKSEVMVRLLSEKGIYISSGSACSTKKLKTSHVLTAFGLKPSEADQTVRVSLSADNTPAEALAFTEALGEGVKRLR